MPKFGASRLLGPQIGRRNGKNIKKTGRFAGESDGTEGEREWKRWYRVLGLDIDLEVGALESLDEDLHLSH